MKTTSTTKKADPHEIGMIAACIADTVMKSLYEHCGQAGIGYIGALDQISVWAIEFYQQYDKKMKNWEDFEESTDNIFFAICWDDFVIIWATEKLKVLEKS